MIKVHFLFILNRLMFYEVLSLILVKEEFIDKISFPDLEKLRIQNLIVCPDAIQLTNTSSLQDFEKSIQK